MNTGLYLVFLQTVSVIVLGLVGILGATKHQDNGPTRVGWILVIVAGLIYISSTSALYVVSSTNQEQLMRRIEGLHSELVIPVMEAPPQAVSLPPRLESSAELQILSPKDGVTPWRPNIEGKVGDPQATVWVVVHPVGLSSYWVQPPVTVRRDGSWRVQVYLGRAGDIDVGKEFEIMAVSNPKEKLNEGRILSAWPEAEQRSDIVTVTRK